MTYSVIGALGHRWQVHTIVAVVIAVTLSWLPSISQAAENVIVATATSQSRVAAISEIIMARAYSALGYKLKVEYLPGKRALKKSNQGRADAELVRIEAVSLKYPNLVRVPEPLFDVRGTAFLWNKHITIITVQDLWGRRVGIVQGIQWAAKLTEGFSPKPIVAKDIHELFQLLANRQIDIALEAQLTGQPELKHFPKRGLSMAIGSITRFPVFHFLHKKNLNLIAPIAEEIRKFKKSGGITKIFKNYYKNSNSGHN